MGTDGKSSRRARTVLLTNCAIAGCAGFWASTSGLRTLIVMVFPVIFLTVGYGAWAVLDINASVSLRGALGVIFSGLTWFWTAVGVIQLAMIWWWVVLLPPGGALVWWLIRRRRRGRETLWNVAEVMSLSADHPAAVLRAASIEELCRLWRLTGQEMREAGQPSMLQWFVEIRQLILDELAARDPDGVARWLAGRPERTDPERYLTRQVR